VAKGPFDRALEDSKQKQHQTYTGLGVKAIKGRWEVVETEHSVRFSRGKQQRSSNTILTRGWEGERNYPACSQSSARTTGMKSSQAI